MQGEAGEAGGKIFSATSVRVKHSYRSTRIAHGTSLETQEPENYRKSDGARYAVLERCLKYDDKQYSEQEYSLDRTRCFAGLGCAPDDRESCGIQDTGSRPN